MDKAERVDPFVSTDEVEVASETNRILKQRVKTAGEGRLVSAEDARQRVEQWLSRSSITKTR